MRLKLLLSIAVSVLLCSLVAQVEAASAWSKTYGGTGYDQGYSLVATSDGGYAIAGVSDSNYGDVLLIKTDSAGNMQWNRTYEGDLTERVHSLIQTPEGGYLMAGNKFSFNLPYPGGYQGPWVEDAWMIKTDSSGNVTWNKTYSRSSSYCGFYSVIPGLDGGYLASGYTTSGGPSWMARWTLWLTKVDSNGSILWNKTYEQAGEATDPFWPSESTIDGGYHIACPLVVASDGCIMTGGNILLKTDALGNLQWNRTYIGTFSSLIATSEGGYAAVGQIDDGGIGVYGSNSSDCWLVKIDASGNLQWSRKYGKVNQNDFANSLVATPDGGYAAVGTQNFAYYVPIGYPQNEIYTGDAWLIKADGFGDMLWNRTYGGVGIDRGYSLVLTSDGGYAMVGSIGLSGYPVNYSSDVWLIKTDGFGMVPEFSSIALLMVIPISVLAGTLFFRKKSHDR